MLEQEASPARRGNKRVIAASVVSVGLAISASLYPIPGDSRLLDLFPSEENRTQSQQAADPLLVQLADHYLDGDLSAVALQATLEALLEGDPAMAAAVAEIPAETLDDFAAAYGLPNLMLALNTLARFMPMIAGGGHGGWGSTPPGLDQGVLPALLMLLEFLEGELPALLVTGSPGLVTKVWPVVLRSLDLLVGAAAGPADAAGTTAAMAQPGAERAAAPPPEPPPADPPTTPDFTPTHQTEAVSAPAFTDVVVSQTATVAATSTDPTPTPLDDPGTESTSQNEPVVDLDPIDVVEDITDLEPEESAVDDTPTADPDPDPSQGTTRTEPDNEPPADNGPKDDATGE
ncbi:hypothetical protein AU195_17925 [Mycobacterium sp. IS-1496]|uniref:hypothetical protein n=1 Tax=Mycobacterium sp. IS-1496 TaxID=1772284 RepID=UPI0007417FA6|nr:hypothetical protein [Mycobacterium sp. IS-1496]KUI23139.1 hypothetical protein AU195_17925 [Mycobacterium sp. IS-1496]